MSDHLSSVPNDDVPADLVRTDWGKAATLFSFVRNNSDRIRETVIPDLIAGGTNARDAFYTLHAAECGGDPALATGFPPRYDEDCKSIFTRGKTILPGTRRTRWIDVSHAWHTAPGALPDMEKNVFERIDGARPADEVAFLQDLTMVQAALLLAHFPEDISGRTTEDFLVYLSRLRGHPISISENGYRGMPRSPSVSAVSDVQDTLFEDIVYAFDQQRHTRRFASREDVQSKGYIDFFIQDNLLTESERREWPAEEGRRTDPTSVALQAYITDVGLKLSQAPGDPGLQEHMQETFPSLKALHRGIMAARDRLYTVFSPEAQQVSDATMGCIAFAPIAAANWNPDYIPAYHTLIEHLRTGIAWLEAHGQRDLASAARKRAEEILGHKTHFS